MAAACRPEEWTNPAWDVPPPEPEPLPPWRHGASAESPGLGALHADPDADCVETLRDALCQQCRLWPRDFDPRFDVVYNGSSHSSSHRGTEKYVPPKRGWFKLALSVADRYDDPDWLRKRSWPVVYHGTSASREVVRGIVHEGFKVRGGQDEARHGERFGLGIYCSPVLEKAMQYAGDPLEVCGVPYTLVFQCRVRPQVYEKHAPDVWLVQSSDDIRPCGVLLRKLLLTDDQKISYLRGRNPYDAGSSRWKFYEKELRHARTVREARQLGRGLMSIQKDFLKGRLSLRGVGDDCAAVAGNHCSATTATGGSTVPKSASSRGKLLFLTRQQCLSRRPTEAERPAKARADRLVAWARRKLRRRQRRAAKDAAQDEGAEDVEVAWGEEAYEEEWYEEEAYEKEYEDAEPEAAAGGSGGGRPKKAKKEKKEKKERRAKERRERRRQNKISKKEKKEKRKEKRKEKKEEEREGTEAKATAREKKRKRHKEEEEREGAEAKAAAPEKKRKRHKEERRGRRSAEESHADGSFWELGESSIWDPSVLQDRSLLEDLLLSVSETCRRAVAGMQGFHA